jgi:hypothetical protein
MECQKQVKHKAGVATRTVLSFRGKGPARLARHIYEVHGPGRRTIKARGDG